MIFKIRLLLSLLLIMPFRSLATDMVIGDLATTINLISFINWVLFVTSVYSIFRFFWPGGKTRFRLHVFNAIFIIVFYSFSLTFLVTHKTYFEGFQALTTMECLAKYFLPTDPVLIIKKLIAVSFIFNVIYIISNRKTFMLDTAS